MRAGSKVSLRIDRQGVLSLQFLVQLGEATDEKAKDEVAFVDFKIVSLYDEDGEASDGTEEDD